MPDNSPVTSTTSHSPPPGAGAHPLPPGFLKLERFRVLLVGGGSVGLEKLTTILRNSPATTVTVVSPVVQPELRTLARSYPHVQLHERSYTDADLAGHDFVLATDDDAALHRRIRAQVAAQHRTAGPAGAQPGPETPKGSLRLAISPAGHAPTAGRRLRAVLEEPLLNERHPILRQMTAARHRNVGPGTSKEPPLLGATPRPVAAGNDAAPTTGPWRRIGLVAGAALGLLLAFGLLGYLGLWPQVAEMLTTSRTFYLFIAIGFGAQLVDGLLGMGYGVITAISLMSAGVPPAAMSASIHTAEMFSSGASGYHHYRFGNVNRRLFKALLIPGVLGSVTGALLLSHFGEQHATWIKPVLAGYLLLLGIRIISRAFRKQEKRKARHIGWLAAAGGFLDSFGGGGWGPLVTSTLISNGRAPQYVIGSVSLTEFFVTFASALTFFATLGVTHWQIVLGLIVGGVAAAPLAARLAGRVPVRGMLVGVGSMVIIWSLWALRGLFM